MICLSCDNNLELFFGFRNVCIQSDQIQKSRLSDCLNIKTEEIILDDLIFQDDFDIDPISNDNDEVSNLENKGYNKEKNPSIHTPLTFENNVNTIRV